MFYALYSGPSRATAGPGKHSRGAPLGRKFLNFSFQNGTFWCTLYFEQRRGPKHRGARGNLPSPYLPTRLSTGLIVLGGLVYVKWPMLIMTMVLTSNKIAIHASNVRIIRLKFIEYNLHTVVFYRQLQCYYTTTHFRHCSLRGLVVPLLYVYL